MFQNSIILSLLLPRSTNQTEPCSALELSNFIVLSTIFDMKSNYLSFDLSLISYFGFRYLTKSTVIVLRLVNSVLLTCFFSFILTRDSPRISCVFTRTIKLKITLKSSYILPYCILHIPKRT